MGFMDNQYSITSTACMMKCRPESQDVHNGFFQEPIESKYIRCCNAIFLKIKTPGQSSNITVFKTPQGVQYSSYHHLLNSSLKIATEKYLDLLVRSLTVGIINVMYIYLMMGTSYLTLKTKLNYILAIL